MRKGVRCLFFCVTVLLFLSACPPVLPVDEPAGDYADEMRSFVEAISARTWNERPGFLVVPHNGEALLTDDGTPAGAPHIPYINSIDGQARDDVFYGYLEDDSATPPAQRDAMLAMLDWAETQGVNVLVIDHCSSCDRIDTSFTFNANRGYASTATCRAANAIPAHPAQPYQANTNDIQSLADAKNMLYLLDPCQYGTCPAYLWALGVSNFDLLVIDSCFAGQVLTPDQVQSLKTKHNGGKRLVLAHFNIGQADSGRAYWRSSWRPGSPAWLDEEQSESAYLVHYWHSEWQAIVFDCIDQILAAGFDGVYLDGIEAYQQFD